MESHQDTLIRMIRVLLWVANGIMLIETASILLFLGICIAIFLLIFSIVGPALDQTYGNKFKATFGLISLLLGICVFIGMAATILLVLYTILRYCSSIDDITWTTAFNAELWKLFTLLMVLLSLHAILYWIKQKIFG